MVEHLVAGDPALAAERPGLVEIGHVEVAHAPGEDLALPLELLEGGEGVLQRVRAAASAAGSSPAGRCRSRASERSQAATVPRARGVAGQDLGDQEDLVAPPGDRLADHLLDAPSPYISAVSMWVMPRSRPRRRAATAVGRCASSMYQVPWPMTATSRGTGPNGRRSMPSGPDGEEGACAAAPAGAAGLIRPLPVAIARVHSQRA